AAVPPAKAGTSGRTAPAAAASVRRHGWHDGDATAVTVRPSSRAAVAARRQASASVRVAVEERMAGAHMGHRVFEEAASQDRNWAVRDGGVREGSALRRAERVGGAEPERGIGTSGFPEDHGKRDRRIQY